MSASEHNVSPVECDWVAGTSTNRHTTKGAGADATAVAVAVATAAAAAPPPPPPAGACCEYTNIFPFSPLFKVSITFLISFQLPLFKLYFLEIMDIFPTFSPSNTLPKNPYLTKGTLGTCSECIRKFPLLESHI